MVINTYGNIISNNGPLTYSNTENIRNLFELATIQDNKASKSENVSDLERTLLLFKKIVTIAETRKKNGTLTQDDAIFAGRSALRLAEPVSRGGYKVMSIPGLEEARSYAEEARVLFRYADPGAYDSNILRCNKIIEKIEQVIKLKEHSRK